MEESSVVPAIEVKGLVRRFGEMTALDHVDLAIRPGEFFSLLGPSGCGKTTLLRIVAGLDLADEGSVSIAGVDASETPAHQRPVNTVFQSYALFPHLSVRDNVAFGLRMKKVAKAEIAERVRAALELVQITTLADRKPSQLSGGQKQRVALARALINEPKVLLLDEPLGALDLKLRKELQVELLALQRRLGITFVFVTHDQEEALVMSDRIAVMKAGRIEQLGDAETLYERPRTRFVGRFLGSCNLLEGRINEVGAEDFEVESAHGRVRALLPPPPADPPTVGAQATLAIRPEKVRLLAGDVSREAPNRLCLQVSEQIYVGSQSHYLFSAREGYWSATTLNSRAGAQQFALGDLVTLELPPSALVLLED